MRYPGIALMAVLAAVTLVSSDYADAARIGSSRSLGTQRQSIAPQGPASPASAPSSGAAAQPVMPAQPGAALPPRPATPAAPAPTGMSRWLGPIAGIAAGLGIAALLSHFGLPEGLGSFLLLALLAVGLISLVRRFLSRRVSVSAPMQYAGTGVPAREPTDVPVWGGAPKPDPVMPAVPAATAAGKTIPPDFDVDGFVRQAKQQFNRLQAAFDAGDLRLLRDVLTPEMLAEIRRDLEARGEHKPTEVVTLDADLLEVVTEGDHHWASVRYTGLLREDGEPLPKPVDEVWNLTKPVDGRSGWLLAGIQQYA